MCAARQFCARCLDQHLTFSGPETLQAILSANPKTKDDFAKLSAQIVAVIIERHTVNPLFPSFAETLTKDICESLNAVQTRKVSSALGVLGNTKQQEERDKASGKKPKVSIVASSTPVPWR